MAFEARSCGRRSRLSSIASQLIACWTKAAHSSADATLSLRASTNGCGSGPERASRASVALRSAAIRSRTSAERSAAANVSASSRSRKAAAERGERSVADALGFVAFEGSVFGAIFFELAVLERPSLQGAHLASR